MKIAFVYDAVYPWRWSGEGYELEVHLFGLKWEDEKNNEDV